MAGKRTEPLPARNLKRLKRLLSGFLLVCLLVLSGCSQAGTAASASAASTAGSTSISSETAEISVTEDGTYDTRDEVALYLHLYGHLPANYMTKAEARQAGWEGGALHNVVEGMCIGGDEFGNFEGTLPEQEGRVYYECDIDTLQADSRGAKRIVYSNDGLIYYTEDHYDSFVLLYGEE